MSRREQEGKGVMVHLCVDIRGALLNWTDRELAAAMQHDPARAIVAANFGRIVTERAA